MNQPLIGFLVLMIALVRGGFAQDLPTAPEPRPFERATQDLQAQLEASVAELTKLREQIAAETLPLSRELARLESELVRVRAQFQQESRDLDARLLELNTLRGDIKAREDQGAFLGNMFGEYLRNFESRLHIAEVDRHSAAITKTRAAMDKEDLSKSELYKEQAALLDTALGRVDEALGGSRFDGDAVDRNGTVHQGTFVLLGPMAFFRSKDGTIVGTAEPRLGSIKPAITGFGKLEDMSAASKAVEAGGVGTIPFDPTLGNAHKIEETKETLWQHILKGGPVMWPILGMAAAALLVALGKWLQMLLVRKPNQRQYRTLLAAVANRDAAAAKAAADRVGGPTGKMLVQGVEHIAEPRELIEEVMYETVLDTKLRLQRLLPFVAISASSAPLLGLLGTVTGIMNTFKLITVFGTGDVKTLSSGISEALITTEYGLIVAIPSLLLHALLSRKAKGVIEQMEKAGIGFINQLSKTPMGADAPPEPPRGVDVETKTSSRVAPSTSAAARVAEELDLESTPLATLRARELQYAAAARRVAERTRSADHGKEGMAAC